MPALLLLLMLVASLLSPGRVLAQECQLTLLTSYPESFYAPLVARFRTSQPSAPLICVLNKNSLALITHVQEQRRPYADLVWASSPVPFELLDQQGLLARLTKRVRSASQFQGIAVDAPNGSRFGFALSQIGIMWHPDSPLPPPNQLAELTLPLYRSQLGMTSAARSGTTHLFVEMLLQHHGWQQGWQLLSQLGGNLATVTARSFGVRDGILHRRFQMGIGIDFLAKNADQSSASLAFQALPPAWVLPASIAVTHRAADNPLALAFIDFLRAPDTQAYLLNPSISRIPIEPSLWPQAGFQPPATPQHFDLALAARRMQVVTALFDQLISYRHQELAQLWGAIQQLQQQPVIQQSDSMRPLLVSAQRLLSEVPVAEFMADMQLQPDPTLTGSSEAPVQGRMRIQDSWARDFSERFARARELIARMQAFSQLNPPQVKP
ncbi:ABC transporter substrate-binding protein [Balneatrix alpica]|uniref:ABC transporter substrate-binding protein n=1 Tax=Balneatrix alpica TaxID=75684 RepID=A0ABV5ZC75_9GAMM|nr:substrate-binding domain-containing protein [Balneatrix alpica]